MVPLRRPSAHFPRKTHRRERLNAKPCKSQKPHPEPAPERADLLRLRLPLGFAARPCRHLRRPGARQQGGKDLARAATPPTDESPDPHPGAGLDRLLIPALIGFGPTLILVLTWDPEGVNSFGGRAIREYAFPIIAIEGIVIGLAFLQGLAAWIVRSPPPRLILLCLAAWAVLGLGTALVVAALPRFAVFITALWVVHGLFGLAA